ncbi:hypothetical protein [uncultured Clostridium sp.]|uniref:hypothetical protein n=1 Tax=uncultured Clostridium sp. TaxID=59620 RepID=UPI0028ECA354|nr:hypothetical protein [uncultured Clostridium sp.]
METDFTISKEEVVNFHMNHVTETEYYKKAIIVSSIFMFLLISLIFVISKHLYYTITAFLIWFVLLIFGKKIILRGVRNKLIRAFSMEKYKSYFEPTKLITNERGLTLITSLSEKTYKWGSIEKVIRIDNYIFITTSVHDDILIHIGSFKSLEQKNLFIDNVIENTDLKLEYKYPIGIQYQ